jgi:hypothetical protein
MVYYDYEADFPENYQAAQSLPLLPPAFQLNGANKPRPRGTEALKTLIYGVTALLLAVGAQANPNQYQWRSFGGVNTDLQPLFVWWRLASETTNNSQDITEMNPAKLASISNLWEHLPPRPLPAWMRITGNEDGITVVGNMWRVEAIIEPAPMMLKREIIYLRNPPVKEIQNFKQARAQYASLQNGQTHQVAAAPALVNVQTNTVRFPGTVTTRNGVVVGLTGAAAVEQNLATAAANSNNAQAANTNQLDVLRTYLASFPSMNVYCLDHFALRTGEKMEGQEIYDLGSAAGLNY